MHCITLWPVEHVTKYSSRRINTNYVAKHSNESRKNLKTLPPSFPHSNCKCSQCTKQQTDSCTTCPTLQWFIQTFSTINKALEAECLIKYLVLQKKKLKLFLFLIYFFIHVKTRQGKNNEIGSLSISEKNLCGVRSNWLLRIMFFVMPGCHPGLLIQVFPVSIPKLYCSLLPFDANSIITGNRIFIFGTLKKATLQRGRGETKSVFC